MKKLFDIRQGGGYGRYDLAEVWHLGGRRVKALANCRQTRADYRVMLWEDAWVFMLEEEWLGKVGETVGEVRDEALRRAIMILDGD